MIALAKYDAFVGRQRGRSSAGFTLMELLVSISIIGLLVSLLLPAVQSARESARRMSCQNNLRQIGLAFTTHHDTFQHFPSDGWGWQWAADARRGNGSRQPSGWCFQILPFIEQQAAYDQAINAATTATLLKTPVVTFHCPSRRMAKLYPYTGTAPLFNSDPITIAAKTDYAVCAGDDILSTPGGPPNDLPETFQSYAWPPFHNATGICYVLTEIRLSAVQDGTSNTILVGEKYLSRQEYTSGKSLGDDQSLFIGDDADIRRWTYLKPYPDSAYDDIQLFGSAHQTTCNFVFCDGSVRPISYTISHDIFRGLGNRHDGKIHSEGL